MGQKKHLLCRPSYCVTPPDTSYCTSGMYTDRCLDWVQIRRDERILYTMTDPHLQLSRHAQRDWDVQSRRGVVRDQLRAELFIRKNRHNAGAQREKVCVGCGEKKKIEDYFDSKFLLT